MLTVAVATSSAGASLTLDSYSQDSLRVNKHGGHRLERRCGEERRNSELTSELKCVLIENCCIVFLRCSCEGTETDPGCNPAFEPTQLGLAAASHHSECRTESSAAHKQHCQTKQRQTPSENNPVSCKNLNETCTNFFFLNSTLPT